MWSATVTEGAPTAAGWDAVQRVSRHRGRITLLNRLLCSALFCFLLSGPPLFAQHEETQRPEAGHQETSKTAAEKHAAEKAVESKPQPEVAPIETHHTLHANGQTLNYTARVGLMPLKNDKGE